MRAPRGRLCGASLRHSLCLRSRRRRPRAGLVGTVHNSPTPLTPGEVPHGSLIAFVAALLRVYSRMISFSSPHVNNLGCASSSACDGVPVISGGAG